MNNNLYLKYKEDRLNAKLLIDMKNQNWPLNKVSKKKDESIANDSKSPPKPILRVSLPIDIFKNFCAKKRTALEMEPPTKKIPKLPDAKICPDLIRPTAEILKHKTQQLRMVRLRNNINLPVSKCQSAPGSSKLPMITSNLLLNKEVLKNLPKNQIKPLPVTKPNLNLNPTLKAATMIPHEKDANISLKHKLPVIAVPAKGSYGIAPKMGISATDTNKCLKQQTEASTQTEKVFLITEDDSNMLDIITRSAVTKEELTKWLDRQNKISVKNNKDIKTTEVIIDLEKDVVNNNINQDTLNLALFHSQINKTRLLGEIAQRNNCSVSKASGMPTRAGTPAPCMEPQNHMEVNKSMIQMAYNKFALANRIPPPAIKLDQNTQTDFAIEKNTKETQPDTCNESITIEIDQGYNSFHQCITIANQQLQYDLQVLLMMQQKEKNKQQMLQSAQQQSFLQQQQRMQLHHPEIQQRFHPSLPDVQHDLQQQQQQQPNIQQRLNLNQPLMPKRLQFQNSQIQRSSQEQSALQLLQLQTDQNLVQCQLSHSEEHQSSQNNMYFQQQQFVPPLIEPQMQYAQQRPNHYLNHSKPTSTKPMKQLFPGDPRARSLRNQVMSPYEGNMQTAQPNLPHQNYQAQYSQNQYW